MKNSYAFRQAIHRPFFWLLLTLLVASATSCQKQTPQPVDVGTPQALYGQLFYDVQKSDIFPDSKTFVDCVPKESPAEIRKAYETVADKDDTKVLKQFLEKHFIIPTYHPISSPDTLPIREHIRNLWSVLLRQPDVAHSGTLIPLPNMYVVPGGRFREVYYWDSYFTMLGLATDGRVDIINSMIDNFAYLIDTIGFIPNGNRTYYLTRSQPPFFALMVSLLARLKKDDSVYVHYLPYMVEEYRFWMHGANNVNDAKSACGHVVRMDGGTLLNRYYDKGDFPRSEAYREDVQTVKKALALNPSLDTLKMYRDIRSAAESGWDFSSRWLKEAPDGSFPLYTMHTTDIVPVDLNALMYNMEKTIAYAYKLKGDSTSFARYEQKAQNRLEALNRYCWNADKGYYFDYDYTTGKQTGIVSLAAVYPLFFHMASAEQAAGIKEMVEDELLKAGGVATTPYNTGQQWDSPNGWAPLQWMTIQGLRNYDFNALANEIKQRWMKVNEEVYHKYHRMEEKYNVVNPEVPGGGGEYPNQDGFGWTNGVYQRLAAEK
ncbi:alpha,alpha-trehalase TreF [Prolixibacter denitrificans]|uniref:Alpha,alpha-trehalase n=1 Tax=Prolixibacter denitrificans TaxID=1541063 RepID=A0A2P8CCJ2_9BACT|nr:alpha,alpha-trehalase TreF [Prolixibacter denitrificans]PSK82697.1 alpha,alpha-trehalase [Prolixibacter denitrificans]GET21481.1 periplasmic trehalase [Prolixibacter denitrificans]